MRTGAAVALVVVGLVGCSSAPEAPPAPTQDGASALEVDPWLTADAGLVAAFKARFEALGGAPACQAALVRDEPEHAHALFLAAGDDALGRALADAFARQAPPQRAYVESLGARRAAPEAHTQAREALSRALTLRKADPDEALDACEEATRLFGELGDPLWSAEARLLAMVLDPAPIPPSADAPTAVQGVQLAVLRAAKGPTPDEERLHAAFERARAVRHATALERLAALRPGVAVEATWTRTLCEVALGRRLPLVALRHAAVLVRDRAQVPPGDRLLVARAHQLAAQTEPALAHALQAVDDAKASGDLRAEASARALVAELLLDLGRPDPALEEFAAAEQLFLQAGDPDGRLRQAVNRAGLLVRLKRLDEAEAALAPVRGLSLPGEDGADLACRRDVTAALLELVAGRIGGDEATRRVEAALDVARAAGAYHAVERYADLPKRLRPGPG